MDERERTLSVRLSSSGANVELFFHHWQPQGECRAIVLIAHGLAEHGGRYQDVAADLNRHGFGVYALDHYGHGRSPGQRCHVTRFSDYLDGMDALMVRAQTDWPDVPMLLLGHSMGGLIAAAWLIDRSPAISACVLSGAAILPPKPPSAMLIGVNRVLAALAPRSGVLQLESAGVSRDPKVVERYEQDPLVHRGKISARLSCELLDTMQWVRDRAPEITLPTLVLHGSADRLTSPNGSRLLHERISSEHKDLIIYDDLYHEIMNEPERDLVMRDVMGWFTRESS